VTTDGHRAAPHARWLFADQLGPHYLGTDEDPGDDGGEVLLVESAAVFRRRAYHRRKAHLVLSALRHRAAELGERAELLRADTYGEALRRSRLAGRAGGTVSVCDPTSWAARRFVRRLADGGVAGVPAGRVRVLPERGYAASPTQFARWAADRGRRRLLMDDFYRGQRRRLDLLLDHDGEPAGGSWSYDHDNREPPPRGARRLADAVDLPEPWWPAEDDIDAEVRADLDRMAAEGVRFVGDDGPRRFAVTHAEAWAALDHFLDHRLAAFGPYEDAMLAGDRWMAHSLLSVPINLGLLHPVEVARAAEARYRAGTAPLASVEGFVRQVVGWRDYVWHMYWHGGEDYRDRNALAADRALPDWFDDLDPDTRVRARCLSDVLAGVREEGWVHHIPRLMVLGNWASQRGYHPAATAEWFRTRFVDGYDWVMVANVVGMATHADGGLLATKPYVSGGAYIDRMSDYCGGCEYDPRTRVGDTACPFTAGYWSYVDRHEPQLAGNQRMARAVAGLHRLKDRHDVAEQERRRGDGPP
jgi:deoxyribodipyrimidine photolyase-related protein